MRGQLQTNDIITETSEAKTYMPYWCGVEYHMTFLSCMTQTGNKRASTLCWTRIVYCIF